MFGYPILLMQDKNKATKKEASSSKSEKKEQLQDNKNQPNQEKQASFVKVLRR